MFSQVRNVPVFSPDGSIGSSRSMKLSQDIRFLLSSGFSMVLIDLGNVPFMNKATITMLADLSAFFRDNGAHLFFSNPRDVVSNLIALSRVEENLSLFCSTLEGEAHIIENFGDVDFFYFDNVDEIIKTDSTENEESLAALSKLAVDEQVEESHLSLDDVIDREILREDDEDSFAYQEAVSTVFGSQTDAVVADDSNTFENEVSVDEVSVDEVYADKACADKAYADKDDHKGKEDEFMALSDEQLSDLVKSHKPENADFDYTLDDTSSPDGLSNFPSLVQEPSSSALSDKAESSTAVDKAEFSTAVDKADLASKPIAIDSVPFKPAEIGSILKANEDFSYDDFDTICANIKSSNPKKRWYAVRSLGQSQDTRGIAVLEELLAVKKEFQFVKDMARLSLGRLNKLYNPVNQKF